MLCTHVTKESIITQEILWGEPNAAQNQQDTPRFLERLFENKFLQKTPQKLQFNKLGILGWTPAPPQQKLH